MFIYNEINIIIRRIWNMIGNQNVLKLGSRSKIFNFIEENPGLHIREIGRRLDMPRGTVRYHVKYLKKAELIEEKYEVGYKRIYCVNKLSAVEKKLLKLLRQEIPCKIFLHLIFSISFSQIEISRELELSPPTVNYHLKKLMDINFIERAPVKDGYIHPFNDDRAVMENTTIGREVFYKRKDPKFNGICKRNKRNH